MSYSTDKGQDVTGIFCRTVVENKMRTAKILSALV